MNQRTVPAACLFGSSQLKIIIRSVRNKSRPQHNRLGTHLSRSFNSFVFSDCIKRLFIPIVFSSSPRVSLFFEIDDESRSLSETDGDEGIALKDSVLKKFLHQIRGDQRVR